jgi:Na+/H+ antiporter NhaA
VKTGEREGFVGWLFILVAAAQLPLALRNLLTDDLTGAMLNGVGAALALFIARRAFQARAKVRDQ